MNKQSIINHFTKGLSRDFRGWVGTEVETHFVDSDGHPITLECSQRIFRGIKKYKWQISAQKKDLITELKRDEEKILYDLGRQCIEFASRPAPTDLLYKEILSSLHELYDSAERCGAYPLFEPIIKTDDDLLVIPDERDASWVKLDGRKALNLCARTASVQFTVETKGPRHAIKMLNHLANNRARMLEYNPYPQEEIWKKYIKTSKAGYREDRYGVVRPSSIKDYVEMLSAHKVVVNGVLIPFKEGVQDIDIFLRSVWWNFRLRRYSNRLCIEIRTLARRCDVTIHENLSELATFEVGQ
ncbi:MAG: hypothetical protein NTV72_00905 [Candidatus Taylorbacteria bacterium]|nr:hypothetical protein [Candidatus Taylorbacteria bacterium]